MWILDMGFGGKGGRVDLGGFDGGGLVWRGLDGGFGMEGGRFGMEGGGLVWRGWMFGGFGWGGLVWRGCGCGCEGGWMRG